MLETQRRSDGQYPLVICDIAIENGHLEWIFPLKIVIFNSYVKLPEGICQYGFEFLINISPQNVKLGFVCYWVYYTIWFDGL